MKQRVSYWGPVVLYAGIIFYLSSLPSAEPPSVFGLSWDFDPQKFVLHIIEYSILGYLLLRAFVNSHDISFAEKALAMATLFGFAYGITDEVHQYFVPFRTASFFDALADGLGSFIGAYGRSSLLPRILR